MAVAFEILIVFVPVAPNTIVLDVPPFIAYVTVAFAVPLIVKVAVAPLQIGELEATDVIEGNAMMVTFPVNVDGLVHDPLFTWLNTTETFAVELGTVIVPTPEALIVVVVGVPPFTVYVTVALAVPFTVKIADAPEQIGELLVIEVTFGNAFTTTEELFVKVAEHVPKLIELSTKLTAEVGAVTVIVA